MEKTEYLEALVDYQSESIVSRQPLDKKAGTITIFAFDQGQGLSEHTAPYDAFVQILDGVGEINIAGEKHTVSEGEFIIMPAGKPHSVKANEKFKMLLVMIRSD